MLICMLENYFQDFYSESSQGLEQCSSCLCENEISIELNWILLRQPDGLLHSISQSVTILSQSVIHAQNEIFFFTFEISVTAVFLAQHIIGKAINVMGSSYL